MSHSNPLCCTNIKYDFSFFNPNLDQKSYFWGWFNFLALVARLFLKSLFFLTKIFGVISGKICGGDNQVFLTLKYFHTNVLVFVKVRLEHSILSDILLFFLTKYLIPHMSGITYLEEFRSQWLQKSSDMADIFLFDRDKPSLFINQSSTF